MDGAKAYQMPANSVVPPFDADNDIMYVKSTDSAGFPAIRAFAFQPVENQTPQTRRYVTREEFHDTLAKLKEAVGNGKQVTHSKRPWPLPRSSNTPTRSSLWRR